MPFENINAFDEYISPKISSIKSVSRTLCSQYLSINIWSSFPNVTIFSKTKVAIITAVKILPQIFPTINEEVQSNDPIVLL